MAERALDEHEGYIRWRVEVEHASHHELCEELRATNPGVRGYSIRSIERFCREKGIHKSSRLPETAVEQVVAEAVAKVVLMCQYSSYIV